MQVESQQMADVLAAVFRVAMVASAVGSHGPPASAMPRGIHVGCGRGFAAACPGHPHRQPSCLKQTDRIKRRA